MKATVQITFLVDSLEDVERIVHAGMGSSVTLEATSVVEESEPAGDGPADSVEPTPAEKRSAAAKKAAATKAANKAKKEAADKAAAGTPVDDDPLGIGVTEPAPAVKVDEAGLKKAVTIAIKEKGIDAVRSVFGGFKSKSGEECAKLSDVKEKDYAKVVEALA